MSLTPTMRQVLTNMHAERPMWQGVPTMNPGAGIPSVVTALMRANMIGNDIVRGGFRLTDTGKRAVETGFQGF